MSGGVHLLDAKAPEGLRLYAVGDVHGRLDLLRLIHAEIEAEIEREQPADWRIIYLGDYVDRGPDSRGAIDFLVEAIARDGRCICLAGNHDVGLLEFLSHPSAMGLFARNGGQHTAHSYGVDIDFFSHSGVLQGRDALAAALPPSHRNFLETLTFFVEFGDFFFCHAGIRPGIPLDRQDPDDLVWIRREFHNHPGLHPKVIVHGHTPSPEPEILANRVNIDTGAFHTGRLTALAVEGAAKRILSVTKWGMEQFSVPAR